MDLSWNFCQPGSFLRNSPKTTELCQLLNPPNKYAPIGFLLLELYIYIYTHMYILKYSIIFINIYIYTSPRNHANQKSKKQVWEPHIYSIYNIFTLILLPNCQ